MNALFAGFTKWCYG